MQGPVAIDANRKVRTAANTTCRRITPREVFRRCPFIHRAAACRSPTKWLACQISRDAAKVLACRCRFGGPLVFFDAGSQVPLHDVGPRRAAFVGFLGSANIVRNAAVFLVLAVFKLVFALENRAFLFIFVGVRQLRKKLAYSFQLFGRKPVLQKGVEPFGRTQRRAHIHCNVEEGFVQAQCPQNAFRGFELFFRAMISLSLTTIFLRFFKGLNATQHHRIIVLGKLPFAPGQSIEAMPPQGRLAARNSSSEMRIGNFDLALTNAIARRCRQIVMKVRALRMPDVILAGSRCPALQGSATH